MATQSYGSFGGGFAQGLQAGSAMADKWVGAYNTAYDRGEMQQASEATPDPGPSPVVDKIMSDMHVDRATAESAAERIRQDPASGAKILNSLSVGKAGVGDATAGAPPPAPADAVATPGVDVSPVPTPQSTTTALTPPKPPVPNLGATTGSGAPMGFGGSGGPDIPPAPPSMGVAPDASMGAGETRIPPMPATGTGPNGPAPATSLGPGETQEGPVQPGQAIKPPPVGMAPMGTPPAADSPEAVTARETAAGKIAGLDMDHFKAYVENVAGTEASGAGYQSVNKQNYLGRYQFGAEALTDLGYVKPGTKQAGLNDPNNWTGKDGIKSANSFLGNPEVQNNAFQSYTEDHYQQLRQAGLIKDDTPDNQIAGLLKGAHLGGVQGVTNLVKNGVDREDANHTKISDYVSQGRSAFDNLTPSEAKPGAPGTQDTQALATKPAAQLTSALKVPAIQSAVADDLKTMERIQTRTYVDPKTTFTVQPDGTVMMQAPKQANDSDRYLRMARVAAKQGKGELFKQFMDAHLTARAEEASGFLDSINKSDMSDDNKVAAMAHGTGIQIYKTADGQYVVPALSGSPDGNGQYRRYTADQIGGLAKNLATAEGQKNLIAYQGKQAEIEAKQAETTLKTATENRAINKQNFDTDVNAPGSEASLRYAQGQQALNADPAKVEAARVRAQGVETRATAAAKAADERRAANEEFKRTQQKAQWDRQEAVKNEPNVYNVPDSKDEVDVRLPVPGWRPKDENGNDNPPPAHGQIARATPIPDALNSGGKPGYMLKSEAAKADQVVKDLGDSGFSQAQGRPAYVQPTILSPIQPNRATNRLAGNETSESGKLSFLTYGYNPATKRAEPVVMVDGKPKFATADSAPHADTVQEAAQSAKEYMSYIIAHPEAAPPGWNPSQDPSNQDIAWQKRQALTPPKLGVGSTAYATSGT